MIPNLVIPELARSDLELFASENVQAAKVQFNDPLPWLP
jgi:hypothetical protein